VYGLIAKITIAEGKRGEMIDILKASAAAIPGCHRYVIAKDAADANVVWVTEVWDSQTSHDSSVALPAAQAAIPRARAIVTRFEKVAVTEPVWDAASDGVPKG
jgi:quinol monooxygenase YgiN